MQAIKYHPEAPRCSPDDQVVARPSRTDPSSRADLALVSAMFAPLAIVGLLVLIGVAVVVAVCIMFVAVFAVTTTLDVVWLRRNRRAGNNLRRTRA